MPNMDLVKFCCRVTYYLQDFITDRNSCDAVVVIPVNRYTLRNKIPWQKLFGIYLCVNKEPIDN
jgi:hypothetical protein